MTWSERGGFWGVAKEGVRRFVGGTFELHPMPQPLLADVVYFGEGQDGTIWAAAADGRAAHVGTRTQTGLLGLEDRPVWHALARRASPRCK